jgi:hypothetical protein
MMKDIVDKVDRAKAIAAEAMASDGPTDDQIAELGGLAIDFLGEIVANSRRVATALEDIANSQRSIAMHGPS